MALVLTDHRICFAIHYYDNEEEADREGAITRAEPTAYYNGGFYHGMSCGREPGRDYVDDNGVPLFAVTF